MPLVVLLAMFALLAVVGQKLRQTGNFASVSLETNDGLAITFLRHGLRDRSACEQAGASLAGLMLANCPVCKVTSTQCLGTLSDEQRALFTEAPSNRPTARLPNGVVTYFSADPRQALAACELSEKQAGRDRVACFAPGAVRAFAERIKGAHESIQLAYLSVAGLIAGGAAVLLLYLSFAFLGNRSTGPISVRQAILDGATLAPFDIRPAKFTLVIVDAMVLLGTYLAVVWPKGMEVGWGSPSEQNALLVHIGMVAFTIGWFWVFSEHYGRRRPFWDELQEQVKVIATMFLIAGAATFAAGFDTSRSAYLWVWFLNLILLPLGRSAARGLLDIAGRWQVPTVILGVGDNARDALEILRGERSMGYRVMAQLEIGGDVPAGVRLDELNGSIPIVPVSAVQLTQVLSKLGSPQLVIALDSLSDVENQHLVQRLSATATNIHIIPSMRGLPLLGTQLSHFFSHDVLFLTVRNNLARRTYRWLKRGFDFVAATLLILLLSPLLAALSILIRKDGGTAMYGHTRVGRDGRKFKCLKFRSMQIDADKVLKKLLEDDPAARAEWDKDFKLKNDPRITRIGHFLRKTSLDELPQLFNVVMGDMSLVGPRPIVEEELERYGEQVALYLEVNPGMTGLWQISGRNDTTYAERVALDTWYVQNWSLWYDIAILFKTIGVVFKRSGAY